VTTRIKTPLLACRLKHFGLKARPVSGVSLLKYAVCCAFLSTLIFASAAGLTAKNSANNTPNDAPLQVLGKILFFSKKLSVNNDIACATCHDPANAYADGRAVARSRDDRDAQRIGQHIDQRIFQQNQRNTPSLLTSTKYTRWSWDGRNQTLEAQVLEPLFSANEHGFSSERQLLATVRDTPTLAESYMHAYGNNSPFTMENIAAALASYVRHIGNTADQHTSKPLAPTLQVTEGRALFNTKAGCAQCHEPTTGFTDNQFHLRYQGALEPSNAMQSAINRMRLQTNSSKYQRNAQDATIASLGAFVAHLDPQDIGKFRTPSLLYVARTAPYMHDGSVTALRDAIEIETKIRAPKTDFSRAEIDALTAYVSSLGGFGN
jgi:cytochrome c peroxidase